MHIGTHSNHWEKKQKKTKIVAKQTSRGNFKKEH